MLEHIHSNTVPKVENFFPYSAYGVLAQNIFGILKVMLYKELKMTEPSEPEGEKPALDYLRSHCAKKGVHLLSPFYT